MLEYDKCHGKTLSQGMGDQKCLWWGCCKFEFGIGAGITRSCNLAAPEEGESISYMDKHLGPRETLAWEVPGMILPAGGAHHPVPQSSTPGCGVTKSPGGQGAFCWLREGTTTVNCLSVWGFQRIRSWLDMTI